MQLKKADIKYTDMMDINVKLFYGHLENLKVNECMYNLIIDRLKKTHKAVITHTEKINLALENKCKAYSKRNEYMIKVSYKYLIIQNRENFNVWYYEFIE